jgi:flagellar protein FlaG
MAEQNLINPIAPSASLELGVGLSGAGARSAVPAPTSAGSAPATSGPAPGTAGGPAAGASAPPLPAGAGAELQSAAQKINSWLASVGRVMELHVDAASGLTVATIKDAQTGQVLQQMPSADLLELAEMLSGWSHGKAALLDLIA